MFNRVSLPWLGTQKGSLSKMALPKSDSSKYGTDKPCSHHNVSVLVLFVFLVSACVAFALLFNTTNHRLAEVEKELKYHRVQLNTLNQRVLKPNDEQSTIQGGYGLASVKNL